MTALLATLITALTIATRTADPAQRAVALDLARAAFAQIVDQLLFPEDPR